MIENVSVHLEVCKLRLWILTDICFLSNFYPVGWRENDDAEWFRQVTPKVNKQSNDEA